MPGRSPWGGTPAGSLAWVQFRGYILIVETDHLIRELLERWLREAGYAVVSGAFDADGESGAPRLVIANVSDPHRAEAAIAALQALHPTPFLVLSARFHRGLGDSVEAARRLGVRKVLPKPFTREELLAAVSEAIG